MWDKFVANVEKHPYLFGGVALAVVIWMFWGGSSSSNGSTSSISAAESQAIADSAQANAQLQLSNDQVQMNGTNAAAAQAINANNNAASVQIAQTAAAQQNYNDDAAVRLAGVQAGAQAAQDQAVLASQNSFQTWLSQLEASGGIIPANAAALGFNINSSAPIYAPNTNAPGYAEMAKYGLLPGSPLNAKAS